LINEIIDKLIEYIKVNKGKVVGGFIGFLLSILVLTIGFWKSSFIISCTWIGCFLGKKSYSREDIKEIFNRLTSLVRRN